MAHVEAGVDLSLHQTDGFGWCRGKLQGEFLYGGIEAVRVRVKGHHASIGSFPAGIRLAQDKKFHGPRDPKRSWLKPGAARQGVHAPLHHPLVLQSGIVLCDPEIARHGEVQSHTEGIAVNRRDGRLAQFPQAGL